jgi:HEPN superfamily RiboL-PSP-like protein
MRIDGENSMLIIKEPKEGLTYKKFTHDYSSEILRAALVAAVSAFDKYMHDAAVIKCYKLLTGAQKDIPRKLKDFETPTFEAFEAMKAIRKDASSRPGSSLKKALQKKLHRMTFQSASDVDSCIALMGVSKFWSRLATEIKGGSTSETLKKELNGFVKRRNSIVHEADIERKISSAKVSYNEIKKTHATDAIAYVKKFVDSADTIFDL